MARIEVNTRGNLKRGQRIKGQTFFFLNRNAINGVRGMYKCYYVDKAKIKEEFMNYFKRVLNREGRGMLNQSAINDLMETKSNPSLVATLVKEVSELEIKEAMFDINNNKTLSLNAYKVFFFKKSQDIFKEDIVATIQNFFNHKHLLKEVNCTILALFPKVTNPSSCTDYRLIVSYNTIYKCITKILANRLKPFFPSLIGKT